jgi:hypothetical protein
VKRISAGIGSGHFDASLFGYEHPFDAGGRRTGPPCRYADTRSRTRLRILIQRPRRLPEVPLGPVDGRPANSDPHHDGLVADASVRSQQLEPLALACRVLTPAQKHSKFRVPDDPNPRARTSHQMPTGRTQQHRGPRES